MERLKEMVKIFRKTIDDSLAQLSFLISFHAFPRGACGDASDILGRFLNERGEGLFEYVSGRLGRQTHAWLEGHNLIVDITADQSPDIFDSAIVTTNRSWHDSFVVAYRRKPGFYGCPAECHADLEKAYQLLVEKLNSKTG
jgi:hypothetical protein